MSSSFAPRFRPEEIERFRSGGFTAISRISPPDEIAWLRDTYAEILADANAFRLKYELKEDASKIIDQIFMPERQCPKLLETAYIAHARRLAAELLEVELADCTYRGMMMIYKPPGAGRDAPWHQDEAYWDNPNEKFHSVSVWMPLDDVTVESGCMQFIPGTQKHDLLPHTKPPGLEPITIDAPFDPRDAVPCPLPAGGATFHHCRTFHHTAANTSPNPRRAFTTIFDGPRTPRAVPIPRTWLADS